MDVIDFCESNNHDQLKYFLKKFPKETIFSIVIRYYGRMPSDSICKAYEEACKIDKDYVSSIETKYSFINK
ncbi:hypothetical protein A0H76_625 [Hepatospora eriocheir]|nr:hypothetical protein A0H76_625 [Hepatospora eriocheir]